MSKQTAVEWLMEQLKTLAFDENHHLGMGDIRITQGQIKELERKAKSMEREQIESAFNSGTNFDAFRPDCPAGNTYYEAMYEKRRVMIADLKDFFNFSKYVNNKYKGGER